MAKKSSPTLDLDPSPLTDPFDGPGLPDEPLQPPPPLKTGPSCGQLVGGFVEIILIALIVVMLCGLISGGAVYLGQQQGVLAAEPANAPTAVPGSLDALPTVAPLNVPTLAAVAAERTLPPPADTPSETAEPTEIACADGAAWWFSQQAAFEALAHTLPGVAFGGDNADAARLRLTPQRDALQAAGAPRCLETAQAALLNAYDQALAGLDSAADLNTLSARIGTVTEALAGMLVALWERGVFTAVDAPTTRLVERGSGAGCADDWRAATAEIWTPFTAQAAAARTATALNRNLAIGQLTALRDQAAALAAPGCVNEVQRLALLWMDSTLNALRAQAAGDVEADRAAIRQAAQTAVQLRAWQTWLEVSAF